MASTTEVKKQLQKVPPVVWLLAGVAAVGLLGAGATARRAAPAPAPAPGGQPGQPSACEAVFNRTFYPKTRAELVNRAQEAIHQANPNLRYLAQNWERTGKQYSRLMAEYLVDICEAEQMRLDIVMAICHIESHFEDYASLEQINEALVKSWNGSRWLCRTPAIGPMQTFICALSDVMNLEAFRKVKADRPMALRLLVVGGVRYLELIQNDYLRGYSWCDVIRGYYIGPTAIRRGLTADEKARADAYLKKFLAVFPKYSHVRNI